MHPCLNPQTDGNLASSFFVLFCDTSSPSLCRCVVPRTATPWIFMYWSSNAYPCSVPPQCLPPHRINHCGSVDWDENVALHLPNTLCFVTWLIRWGASAFGKLRCTSAELKLALLTWAVQTQQGEKDNLFQIPHTEEKHRALEICATWDITSGLVEM